MRLLNWRRQAVLNAMLGLKPEHIRTRGLNSGGVFAISLSR